MALFPIDDNVTLTELERPASTFGGWRGGCSTTNGNTCMVKMSVAKNVSASFYNGFEKPLYDSVMGVAEDVTTGLNPVGSTVLAAPTTEQ